jgi:hypothetical protein
MTRQWKRALRHSHRRFQAPDACQSGTFTFPVYLDASACFNSGGRHESQVLTTELQYASRELRPSAVPPACDFMLLLSLRQHRHRLPRVRQVGSTLEAHLICLAPAGKRSAQFTMVASEEPVPDFTSDRHVSPSALQGSFSVSSSGTPVPENLCWHG